MICFAVPDHWAHQFTSQTLQMASFFPNTGKEATGSSSDKARAPRRPAWRSWASGAALGHPAHDAGCKGGRNPGQSLCRGRASHPRDVRGGGPHAPSPNSKGTTECQASSQTSNLGLLPRSGKTDAARGGLRGGWRHAGKSTVRHGASRDLSPGLSGQVGIPRLSKRASPPG